MSVEQRTRRQASGPSAIEGLRWLARIGPAPLEAWTTAMGWSQRIAYRKARQLEQDGWLERERMTYGDGSLLTITRLGVMRSGVPVTAPPRPAPTWWAHLSACAWVAAWLTIRGRQLQGPREIDADGRFSGEITWGDSRGRHTVRHRPDLAWVTETTPVAIEVELARKSNARLDAILALHAGWRRERKTGGVLYVCGDKNGRDRITDMAARHGLHAEGRGGLRIEELSGVCADARDALDRTHGA
ncbi:MAG: hypothetical protein ACRET5_06190 [Steroidobacteraceae bacterium]